MSEIGNPNDYYEEDGTLDCIIIVNHI